MGIESRQNMASNFFHIAGKHDRNNTVGQSYVYYRFFNTGHLSLTGLIKSRLINYPDKAKPHTLPENFPGFLYLLKALLPIIIFSTLS